MSMQDVEIIERFVEGLKKASSRCRELGAIQKSKHWNDISANLDKLLANGLDLYKRKEISRQDALKILDERQKNLKIN